MMKTPPPYSTWRIAAVAAATTAGMAAAAVLFVFDPSTAGCYPACTLHAMTGWQCPGCGGLRALHQLSHGHIAAAWRLNPLLVALLPAGVWLGLGETARLLTGRPWPGVGSRPIFGWFLAGVLVLFGILRNVPFLAGP